MNLPTTLLFHTLQVRSHSLGVDKLNKAATVTTTAITPPVSYTVSWSKLSRLDESQNAARIVREARENK